MGPLGCRRLAAAGGLLALAACYTHRAPEAGIVPRDATVRVRT